MTVHQNLLLTAACLFFPSSSHAFVVPKLSSPATHLLMQPDGTDEWMLRDPQEYNARPNPPTRRREAILERYRPGQQPQQRDARGQPPGPHPLDPRQPNKDQLPGHLYRKSEEQYDTNNPDMYRPANRFDQNDPFVNTPYGQANDIKRPQQQRMNRRDGVSYARANVNQWKAEQDQQDAFVNGAYGSGGPNRHGLEIGQGGGGGGHSPNRRQQYRGDPQTQQQQDFIDGPYGSRGAPNGYENARPGRTVERAPGQQGYANDDPQAEFANSPYGNRQGPGFYEAGRGQSPREIRRAARRGRRNNSGDPQADFANSPYGNRNAPAGYDAGDFAAAGGGPPQKQYERYRKDRSGRMPPTPEEQFRDLDYAGSNRMEYQGGPAAPPSGGYERYNPENDPRNTMRDRDQMPRGGPQQAPGGRRLERFNARMEDKRQYSDRSNDIIERSPGKHLTEEFDPRRYESRPIRSREQRDYELEEQERRQWEHRRQGSAQEEFVNNPNGSSYRASQYGHGNDGW